MNDLSILLYLADIVGNVKEILGPITGILLFVTCIVSFIGIGLDNYIPDEAKRISAPWIKRSIYFVVITGLVLLVTPSRQTVYLIAASEMGEEVLKTPMAGKLEQALDEILESLSNGE